MIRLDTGTPGAGKTLINVRDIVTLEKDNEKNINLNNFSYFHSKILNKNRVTLRNIFIIINTQYEKNSHFNCSNFIYYDWMQNEQ